MLRSYRRHMKKWIPVWPSTIYSILWELWEKALEIRVNSKAFKSFEKLPGFPKLFFQITRICWCVSYYNSFLMSFGVWLRLALLIMTSTSKHYLHFVLHFMHHYSFYSFIFMSSSSFPVSPSSLPVQSLTSSTVTTFVKEIPENLVPPIVTTNGS